MLEAFFSCPNCWENISMLVDQSIEEQEYIEDCEVCCNPIQLKIRIEQGEIIYLETLEIGQ